MIMFGKLMKWELKNQRLFFGLCAALIAVGAASSVMNTVCAWIGENTATSFVTLLCKIITVSAAYGLLITWLLITCTRFRSNLFKDEGYLMHTLPVSAEELVFSKILSPAICFLISLAAIYLELSIYRKDFTYLWDIVHKSFSSEFPISNSIIILVLVLAALQITLLICALYMSISSGQRFLKNRDVMTALIFILLYNLYEVIGTACLVGISLPYFSSIGANAAPNISVFLGGMCIIDTLAIIICTAFTVHNIKKHLNLE